MNGLPTIRESRHPDAKHTSLFGRRKDQVILARAGFVEVASAGMLARKYRWSGTCMRFQPRPRGMGGRPDATYWSFDLIVYAGSWDEIAIAVEAKWKPGDRRRLEKSLRACREQGRHREDGCRQSKTNHRKYVGLLDFKPRVLWIADPDAFSETPNPAFVFGVQWEDDDLARLHRVDGAQLEAPARTSVCGV